MTASGIHMTADELLRLPDNGMKRELIAGQCMKCRLLVESTEPSVDGPHVIWEGFSISTRSLAARCSSLSRASDWRGTRTPSGRLMSRTCASHGWIRHAFLATQRWRLTS